LGSQGSEKKYVLIEDETINFTVALPEVVTSGMELGMFAAVFSQVKKLVLHLARWPLFSNASKNASVLELTKFRA
jgi:hypothetical protein